MRIPKFKNEAEEAAWWDAHPELLTAAVQRARQEGQLRRTTPAPTQPVTIRLLASDIELAQHLAEQKGIGYQTYIKMLLHEALRDASNKAA
jgi:predicted DNA binding CopG/RHH family protein